VSGIFKSRPVERQKCPQNFTKTIRLDPNRKFYVARFFCEDQELLTCEISGDRVYDCSDIIPDGNVKFVNETDQTYGEQSYFNGVRDGQRREYYHTGQLKTETQYVMGSLEMTREYFIDGILKMEQDLTDALWFSSGKDNIETGVGKVYYRDGTLMYEWHLTNQDQGGYKKSYNQDGQVVSLRRFNERGELVSSERFDYP
jgi:antitoxin component YwqK of YwqJK toxin-antitoxin module